MVDVVEIGIVEEDLSEEELALLEEARRAAAERQGVLDEIARYVNDDYNSKKSAKEVWRTRALRSLELFNSPLTNTYSEPIENKVFGVDEKKVKADDKPYPNIVRSRCKNVISMIIAGQFPTDKNWELRPSPVPEGMDEVAKQEVFSRCRRMELEIQDQLNNCDYKNNFCRSIEDMVVLGAAILKGPTNGSKLKKTYVQIEGTGTFETKLLPIPHPGVFHVSPWFFFPDHTTADPQKIESCIQVHPWTKLEVEKLVNHPGFLQDQLAKAYAIGPTQGESELFDYLTISEAASTTPTNRFLIKEYHGPLDLNKLRTLGLVGEADTIGDTMMVEIWELNGYIIRIAMPVLEHEIRPPYAIAPYEPDPGYVLGYSLPMLTESQQRIVKTATNLLLDNAAMAAFPQVYVDAQQIEPAANGGDLGLKPGKVWLKTQYFDGNGTPIDFFYPPNNAELFLGLIDKSMAWADIDTGVSEIIGNLTSPQEGQGATGVAIANANALTPLLYKQEILVDYLTKPVITWMYDWNMIYNPNPWIKGDFEVDVRTPVKTINASKEKVDLERLSMEMAQNPELAIAVKQDVLTQYRLAGMHLPFDQLIRSPEEQKQMRQQMTQNQGPDPNMLKAQADLLNAEARKEQVSLDRERLAWEREDGMKREEMNHREEMAKAQTRQQELQSRMFVALLERERALAELGAKSDENSSRVLAELLKSDADQQTKLFLAGQDNQLKMRQLDQTDEELNIKRQKGTGI